MSTDSHRPESPVSGDAPTVQRTEGAVSGNDPTVQKTASPAPVRDSDPTVTSPDDTAQRVGSMDLTVASASGPADRGDSTAAGQRPVRAARFIGRFAILRELGRGGMGQVYLAYDETLDRRVAIKLLSAGSAEPGADQRLRREAQAMAKLAHPNVVNVFEVGTFQGQVFVAMEYIPGQTLDEWLAEKVRPWREILAMYIQAAEGLSAAHRANLVHRDFKPANVLVGDERARVLDFGLARLAADISDDGDEPAADSSATASEGSVTDRSEYARAGASNDARVGASTNPTWSARLTQHGAVMGTPLYMSPEQYRAETADARSDQYSFCIALHEALYGHSPFATDSLAEHRRTKEAGELIKPKGMSAELADVYPHIARGLAADTADRWPDIDRLIAELRKYTIDPSTHEQRFTGTHGAIFLGLTAIVLVTVSLVASGLIMAPREVTTKSALYFSASLFVVFSLAVLFARRYLVDSQLAMRSAIFLPLTLGLIVFHRVLAVIHGHPPLSLFGTDLLILTTGCAVAGLTLHRMFWAATAAMGAITVLAWQYPHRAGYMMAVATLVFPVMAVMETWLLARAARHRQALREWITRSGVGKRRWSSDHDSSSSN